MAMDTADDAHGADTHQRSIDQLMCLIHHDRQCRLNVAQALRDQFDIRSESAQKNLIKRINAVQKAAAEQGLGPVKVSHASLLRKLPIGGCGRVTILPNQIFAAHKMMPALKVHKRFLEWMRLDVKYALRSGHVCRHKCAQTELCSGDRPCALALDAGVFEPCIELKRIADVVSFLSVIMQRSEVGVLTGGNNADAKLKALGPDGIVFHKNTYPVLPLFTVRAGRTVVEGFLYIDRLVHVEWLATNLRGGLGSLQASLMANDNPDAVSIRQQRETATVEERKDMDSQYPAALCGFFMPTNVQGHHCLVVEDTRGISMHRRTGLDGFGCLLPTAEINISEVCLSSVTSPFRLVDRAAWLAKIKRDVQMAGRRRARPAAEEPF